MMRYKAFILLLVVTFLLPALPVRAVDFAEPLVGHATVEKPDHTIIHDGMGGNEVVLNPNQETILGFNKTSLESCAEAMSNMRILAIDGIVRCFYMDPTSANSLLMTSRTKRDNYSEVEIAAFIYDKMIRGDVYGLDSGGINFKLYGRNLKQHTSDVSNQTWASGYNILNAEAQAYFSASSDQAAAIRKRIANMASEAHTVRANVLASSSVWYLQRSDLTLAGSPDESKLYPEGKTWLVYGCGTDDADVCADLASRQYKYVGKGTLIFLPSGNNKGADLELSTGTSIKPWNDNPDHSLGIIVADRDASGDVANNSTNAKVLFEGKNSIQAAMLVLGSINISNGGLTGIGSFVAQTFDFTAATKYSIIFNYDPKLENNWPPGFRYFSMPRASAVAP